MRRWTTSLVAIAAALLVTANAAADTVIEGETFTGGTVIPGDPSVTSGGAALRFDSNLTATHSASGQVDRVLLRARAGTCGAHVIVKLNGQTLIDRTITSKYWNSYAGLVPSTSASSVSVTQDNVNANLSPCDNRLRMDAVILRTAPPPTTFRAFTANSVWNIPAAQKGTITGANPYAAAFNSYSTQLEVTKDTTWSKPFCYAKAGDPAYVWDDVNDWNSGDIKYGGEPIPFPAGCHEATGSDGHLVIVTADKHYSYEMWRANSSNKTAGNISRFDLTGSGVPSDTTNNTSARGSGTPLFDTVVRIGDDYQHAAGITVPRVESSYLTPPATHSDGSCSCGVRYGQLYVLRADFPETGNATTISLIRQLKNYGAYVVDQGASFGIDAQPGSDLPGTLPIRSSDLRLVQ